MHHRIMYCRFNLTHGVANRGLLPVEHLAHARSRARSSLFSNVHPGKRLDPKEIGFRGEFHTVRCKFTTIVRTLRSLEQ